MNLDLNLYQSTHSPLLNKSIRSPLLPSGVSRRVHSGAAVLQQSGGGCQSVHATANERLPLQERHGDL